MIVVLPVCGKDSFLAAKNLQVAISLDKKSDLECLVAHDATHNPWDVITLAEQYFAKVATFKYDPPVVLSWPQAPNHAWQSVARYIKDNIQKPWLWLEPDVTPLRSGWLSILWEEYQKGDKPFMGHIVNGFGHMNGVAIYPPDVVSHSPRSMLVQKQPFDISLSEEILDNVHKANHLMAHHPRFTGVTLAIEDKSVVKKMISEGYAIFHGCNDGSLANLMLGEKPPKTCNGSIKRIYTQKDINCTVDESEPFWQLEATQLKSKGFDILPYRECTKDIPSIMKQANCGLFRLPKTMHHVHFNCGVCSDGRDLFLATRQWTTSNYSKWQSRIYVWKLDENLTPRDPIQLQFPDDNGVEQFEDPRIIYHHGRFWVSYCVWQHGFPYRAKQRFSSFTPIGFSVVDTVHVPYGRNAHRINEGQGSEKNWVWFNHEGAWHFVYDAYPHTVVKADPVTSLHEYKTQGRIPKWLYGEMRGGTPPVKVGDEYLTFFHSSLPWRHRQKRYYMGAYTFSAKAPFELKRFTPEPLLSGSEEDVRELGGPLCVFPCGSVFHDDRWLVTGGLNDEACFWMKISHKDLERKMVVV